MRRHEPLLRAVHHTGRDTPTGCFPAWLEVAAASWWLSLDKIGS